MIAMVNERMRDGLENGRESLDYLNREMQAANTVELREAISHLIEQQRTTKCWPSSSATTRITSLSRHCTGVKSAPLRSLIAAGGAILGFMLAMADLDPASTFFAAARIVTALLTNSSILITGGTGYLVTPSCR